MGVGVVVGVGMGVGVVVRFGVGVRVRVGVPRLSPTTRCEWSAGAAARPFKGVEGPFKGVEGPLLPAVLPAAL